MLRAVSRKHRRVRACGRDKHQEHTHEHGPHRDSVGASPGALVRPFCGPAARAQLPIGQFAALRPTASDRHRAAAGRDWGTGLPRGSGRRYVGRRYVGRGSGRRYGRDPDRAGSATRRSRARGFVKWCFARACRGRCSCHCSLLFRKLAGLADGLAPKERRYGHVARLAPTKWFPRFPPSVPMDLQAETQRYRGAMLPAWQDDGF
jgi:hypothetical protein